jgi:hypothetical protein
MTFNANGSATSNGNVRITNLHKAADNQLITVTLAREGQDSMKIFEDPFDKPGMSLLEVLIAPLDPGGRTSRIASLQITAIKGNATADETVVAAYYAQEKMEEFRRTAFDNVFSSAGILSGAPDLASIPTDNSVDSKLSKKSVRIYRVWNVENTTATLKTISVWACWREGGVRWHTMRFVTRKGSVL